MMKQKHLAILIVILIAAILAYFLIHLGNEKQQEKEAQETEEKTQVTDFSTDDVEKIVFGTGVEKISFEKQDDTWNYSADENFAVDQNTVASLLTSLSSITADAEVTDISDTAEYGFDMPAYHAELTMSDGRELTLTFGMENDVVSGYYLQTSLGDEIYLVPSSCTTYLGYTLEQFEQEEETDAEAS